MAKITSNLLNLSSRFEPTKFTKFEERDEAGKHLVKMPKPKKLYDYYICDYCNSEIVIKDKASEQTGGVVKIPQTLSNLQQELYLALCNKCLAAVIKEFEEEQQKNADVEKYIHENYNHIPRID